MTTTATGPLNQVILMPVIQVMIDSYMGMPDLALKHPREEKK